MALEVSLPAEVLFSVGPFPITNAFLAALFVTAFLTAFGLYLKKTSKLVPTRLQLVIESLMEFLLKTLEQSFGSKERARKFFPLLMSLMLFIGIANQFTLFPLIAQLTLSGESLFRSPTSVLGQTVAFSLAIVLFAQILAFAASPLKHIGNYIRIMPLLKARKPADFANAFLQIFLGVLDIFGEIAKVVSLGARLFGNIFAGEVMIAVIASLSVYTMFIVPIPFMVISIFSGVVQTLVFVLLSTQFIAASLPPLEEEAPAA